MSFLKQNTIKKEQIDEIMTELDTGNKDSKKYKVEAIWDNAVYLNKLESGYLTGFYYLVT